MKETSSLHLFFNLPARGIRYALGYQMFGFREQARPQVRHTRSRQHSYYTTSRSSSATSPNMNAGTVGAGAVAEEAPATVSAARRDNVRLSGFGHVGMGGSVALCDPASGLAFAMVTNKVCALNGLCRSLSVYVCIYVEPVYVCMCRADVSMYVV